jgi:hypothetical protein
MLRKSLPEPGYRAAGSAGLQTIRMKLHKTPLLHFHLLLIT